jgi:hypothetical protein
VLKIIPILKKLKCGQIAKGSKIRDIRKKDVDYIVKKLEAEYNAKND